MNILVTGAAGFIGANFVKYVLSQRSGIKVIGLDLLTYAGSLSSLSCCLKDPRFRFVKGDIADRAILDHVFEEECVEFVVNFAAESHVDRSVTDPGVFLRTNTLGAQILMDACRKHKIRRFHQVGTDEVYGELPLDRPDLLFHEDCPLKPSNPYSVSKAAADMLALAYARTYGFPVTISRSSNNYGPYHFPEKLVPKVILHAIRDQPIPLYGDGTHVRDWIFVEDHCAAILSILERGAEGEVYNVGSNFERTNLSLVRAILDVLKKPHSLIQFVKDRPGHDARYGIDSRKLKAELGWQPSTDLAEGICKTVNWFVENERWWRERLRIQVETSKGLLSERTD